MAAAPVPSKSPAPSEATSEKLKQTPVSPSSAAANLDNLDFPHFKDLQRCVIPPQACYLIGYIYRQDDANGWTSFRSLRNATKKLVRRE